MAKLYTGNLESSPGLKEQFKADGIKFCLSIGRRQPFHIAHVNCLQEIISANLLPVVIFGSHNKASNTLYNPLKNPLNKEQQTKILAYIFQNAPNIKYQQIFIEDHLDNNDWIKQISGEITFRGMLPENSIIHYRSKESDLDSSSEIIKPLISYNDFFLENGFSVWQSHNENKSLDSIHSTIFRKIALDHKHEKSRNIIMFDYLKDLASNCREENPMRDLLSKVPLSMADISLNRLAQEKQIDFKEIIKEPVKDITDLQQIIANFIN